jgi:hypothetical protein
MTLPRTPARAAAAILVVAAAAVLPSAAADAGIRTTQPQTIYKAKIVLTDSTITIAPAHVGRGALVQFRLRNTGRTPRDFSIGGYLIHALKPGATRDFQLQFLARGKYPYYSLGHPGTKITGKFSVT